MALYLELLLGCFSLAEAAAAEAVALAAEEEASEVAVVPAAVALIEDSNSKFMPIKISNIKKWTQKFCVHFALDLFINLNWCFQLCILPKGFNIFIR